VKKISLVIPCYNEEENVDILHERIRKVANEMPQYIIEELYIDNASTDATVEKLKTIAKTDQRVKIIVNARNFGPMRSPFYGLTQADGDGVVLMAADLQDPPEMLVDFAAKWEEGHKIVVAVKNQSKESWFKFQLRKAYYNLIEKISSTRQIKNYTGYGLYDREIIQILSKFQEPYPYFRGLIGEIGYDIAEVDFVQPVRQHGTPKGDLRAMLEMGLLGVVSYSKLPLRIAIYLGISTALLSFFISLGYLIYKLLFWDSFQLGLAPIIVGSFFITGVQLFFIGIIGEYIGNIYVHVKNRPLVIERERINFD